MGKMWLMPVKLNSCGSGKDVDTWKIGRGALLPSVGFNKSNYLNYTVIYRFGDSIPVSLLNNNPSIVYIFNL
jgi:hypothetical protein